MADLTEFQSRVLAMLAKLPNEYGSTSELAARLGTSRVAIVSACRSLERAGWALSFRSDRSQWASLMWAPTAAWKRKRNAAMPQSAPNPQPPASNESPARGDSTSGVEVPRG